LMAAGFQMGVCASSSPTVTGRFEPLILPFSMRFHPLKYGKAKSRQDAPKSYNATTASVDRLRGAQFFHTQQFLDCMSLINASKGFGQIGLQSFLHLPYSPTENHPDPATLAEASRLFCGMLFTKTGLLKLTRFAESPTCRVSHKLPEPKSYFLLAKMLIVIWGFIFWVNERDVFEPSLSE